MRNVGGGEHGLFVVDKVFCRMYQACMWSCSLDLLLLPGLWPPHPSAVCGILQIPSRDESKRRHVNHRSMGACGAFYSLFVLVSKCMRTSRWWCVSCGNMQFYLRYVLPRTACLYSGLSPVHVACLRDHLLHACRYWCGGCNPQDTAVERQNSLFVLDYTSSRIWFLYSTYYKMKTSAGRSKISSKLIFAIYVRYFDLVWSKTRMRVVSCITFSCWGVCWSEVLVLIWYHKYVRENCYFWFSLKYVFHFFRRYLVRSR